MDIVGEINKIIQERDKLIKAVEKYRDNQTTGDMFAMFDLLPENNGIGAGSGG